jgi:asparagine synthase (glutamine-hydrolysing)
MCGIFYLSNPSNNEFDSKEQIDKFIAFKNIQHRGPDVTNFISLKNKSVLGFHRLMVNGNDGLSNQPMTLNGETYLLCNGEIYNNEVLQKKYNIKCNSGSDCEIILHLYEKIGFEQTIKELDGEFAIVLVTPEKVYISRDPYGVRALYIFHDKETGQLGVSSENKALYPLFKSKSNLITQFQPGMIGVFDLVSFYYKSYNYYNYTNKLIEDCDIHEPTILVRLRKFLLNAVRKRMMCTRTVNNTVEPAIGAYLSGGFDSSAIAAILQSELKTKLETFSIGFEGSPDLLYARKVAEHIGSNHHECIITEEQALNAIPEVIHAIESYDITTIRASTMMYLLSKYVSEHSKVVVMFSGEGSDEASGSYRYFHNAPCKEDFQKESERLLKDLCYFDNLRADKSSAAWGLEIRVPFLDINFLEYYMTLPSYIKTQNGLEKYILRQSVAEYLPEHILNRPKEAMSDGVSLHGRSWSSIIQEHAVKLTGITDKIDAEKEYYLSIFKKNYDGCESQIPYYWLPRWCGDVKDPSARVLSIYNATV